MTQPPKETDGRSGSADLLSMCSKDKLVQRESAKGTWKHTSHALREGADLTARRALYLLEIISSSNNQETINLQMLLQPLSQ